MVLQDTYSAVSFKGRILRPHKAAVDPDLGSRNVLTSSPWDYVNLWLKREGHEHAVFYWNQANEFYKAAYDLSLNAAPLLYYYSFMNAAKALLEAKRVTYSPYHGVTRVKSKSSKISLGGEKLKLKQQGVIPALSTYLAESETQKTHSLQELIFNLVYVHRTYCLTYKNQTDMFIPIRECAFVYDEARGSCFVYAELSKDQRHHRLKEKLPNTLVPYSLSQEVTGVKSKKEVEISKSKNPTESDIKKLKELNSVVRKDLHYINGQQTLWYVKAEVSGPSRLERQPATLTLAAMHRLSELCRYSPINLNSFLSSQKNWLLSEFIKLAPSQFLDEIAAEITGQQLLIPNVRPPT